MTGISNEPSATPQPRPSRRSVIVKTAAGAGTALIARIFAWTDPAEASETAKPVLAKTKSIPVGGGKIVKGKYVITQPKRGVFRCFSAICTHQGCTVASVSHGKINCPCHGSKFHITDGSVAHGPATRGLPVKKIKVSKGAIRLK